MPSMNSVPAPAPGAASPTEHFEIGGIGRGDASPKSVFSIPAA
jgi:hypothetical protein